MEIASGITMIDTLLGGQEGITAAYLVSGTNPALVETGAQTSVPTLKAALESHGVAAGDLAWIVLTHIHLDHAGGVGDMAAAFPKATIVVHPRGARHLVEPERLIAGTAAVHGPELAPLYGGLTPTPEDRIIIAESGHRIPLGGSRELIAYDAPGHARHQMMLVDESTGTVMAGDALGVQFPGSGLYPSVPPPEFDVDAAVATLDTIRDLDPTTLLLGHFGPVADPQESIALAVDQQSRAAEAARAAYTSGGAEAVEAAVYGAIPLADAVRTAAMIDRWQWLRWDDNNVKGLTMWAEKQAKADSAAAGG